MACRDGMIGGTIDVKFKPGVPVWAAGADQTLDGPPENASELAIVDLSAKGKPGLRHECEGELSSKSEASP